MIVACNYKVEIVASRLWQAVSFFGSFHAVHAMP